MPRPLLTSIPIAVLLALLTTTAASAQWTQWGGPGRDFQAPPASLATAWPESGPPVLWRRPLGEGFSAIVVADDTLYTMYSRGDQEVLVALDAATGKTRWESLQKTPLWDGFTPDFGRGPNVTPIVAGDLVCGAGIRGDVTCVDRATGARRWSHDLWDEFGAEPSDRGYASSPMVHDGKLIVFVGGRSAVVAFHLADGKIAWQAPSLPNGFSSPILAQVDGQEQLIAFLGEVVAGLDPRDGTLLWQHPHPTQYLVNAMTPIWMADSQRLFVSSGYDGGSRVLQLARKDGKTPVEELWFNRRMKIHHGTAVRIGETLYGSSGDFGPAFLMGVDPATGDVRFQERGFAKANLIAAGNHLLILAEDGELAIATAKPDGLTVHSRAKVLEPRAWTVPTLVGTTLYLRDRKEIVALDLKL